MYSAYKLNKQGDNIQPWCTPFPIWNQCVVSCPVLTAVSWPAYRFLKRQVRWSGIPISFRIFQFILLYASFGNCPNKYYILKFIVSNTVLSCLGRVWLFMTPWALACQAPLSMGFSREEYWIGLPCPPLGDLPGPWIRPMSHISCIGRRILYYYCHLGSDTIDVIYLFLLLNSVKRLNWGILKNLRVYLIKNWFELGSTKSEVIRSTPPTGGKERPL